MRWKHCFMRYQLIGSYSSRARSGSPQFSSYSLTSAVPTCSVSCTSWLPFQSDNVQQRALLVGTVWLRPTRVFAFRKVGFRRKSLTSPQLGSVWLLQSWFSHLRRTFLHRLGAGISIESHLGWSFISHAGWNSDPDSSAIPFSLASRCRPDPANCGDRYWSSHSSERATDL